MFRDIILQQDEKFQNVSPVFKSTLLPVTCRGFKLFIQNPRAFLDKRKKGRISGQSLMTETLEDRLPEVAGKI